SSSIGRCWKAPATVCRTHPGWASTSTKPGWPTRRHRGSTNSPICAVPTARTPTGRHGTTCHRLRTRNLEEPTLTYRGVFPVAPTVFDARGALDLEGQKRCIDFM